MATTGGYYNNDAEQQSLRGNDTFAFSDKSIRRAFIRKVYSILMVQMLITSGFIALFLFYSPIKEWTYANPGVFYGAMAVTLVLSIALACCESVRRKTPTNFICLFVFTIAEAFLLGTAASTFDTEAVLIAAGITTGICLALTLFSFQTKIDFTVYSGFVFVSIIVLLLFGLLAAIIRSNILNIVYASVGALLFSFYLVYDTQLLIGGNHKFAISPEEYIFAALSLYLDVVNIFLYVLQIVGAARD